MGRSVSKRAAELKSTQQLLDTKSDYNNYSNLSYFISEYKKAVQIIAECKTFYRNFLRNKLYSFDDILENPGINLLDFQFSFSEYLKNCDRLYKYFVYTKLSEEFEKKLTKYQYDYCNGDILDYVGCPIAKSNDFGIIPLKGSLFSGLKNNEYLKNLIRVYCFDCTGLKNEKYHVHSYHELNPDKISVSWFEDYDDFICRRDNKKAPNLYKNNTITLNVSGKNVTYNLISAEVYLCEGGRFSKNAKYKPTGEYDYYIPFGEEELKLIDILNKFCKKYKNVKTDIIYNPTKYIDLWGEFVKYKNKKFVDEPAYEYSYGERKYKRVSWDDIKSHKDLFVPVNYYICNPKKEKDEYDYEETNYNVETYTIEGINYLNTELLKKRREICNSRYSDDDYDIDEIMYYKHLPDEFFIKKKSLQQHINEINPDSIDVRNKNADWLLQRNWYYILIDDTPYKFVEINGFDNVKINFVEDKNILECDYHFESGRKKAPWPGWLPWVVTDHHYHLVFDCSTNEPIEYSYNSNSHEEKVND